MTVPPSTRERARGRSLGRVCHHCAPEGLSTGLHEASWGGNTPPFSPLAYASEQACHCQPCQTSAELWNPSRTQTGEDPCLTPPLLQEAGPWETGVAATIPLPCRGARASLRTDTWTDNKDLNRNAWWETMVSYKHHHIGFLILTVWCLG